MYGPTSQAYGSPAAGAQYRASPAPSAVPRQQQYAPNPVYQQPVMYTQSPQQQQQQRYTAPQGFAPGPGAGQAPMGAGYPAGYGGFPQQQQMQQVAQPPPQRRQQQQQQPHKGTIPPGQMVRVGHNTVRVEKYLSEGGYAHVYLTTSENPVYPPKRSGDSKGRWGEKGYTQHCLKRIAFEDESVWADVSKEIEVMKALPASPYLVQYLDSSHHRLPNGQHEVFILMEFCSGGGIIDLLNKRLRDRLKEIEILNIFTDVCEAVAAMHALPRPLLHRDLKIENVLSHPNGQAPSSQRPTPLVFKLCDFGSTTFPASHPPTTKAEADALAMDLNKHTTLQYRSPEMVEPMLGWAVGLPSDVWALGVLLYKLCYYTTPFEEHGTLAIVNAKYTFPQYPVYSPRLQHLIASMLVEHPTRRPNVFEVLKAAHEMSGTAPMVDYPSPANRNALPPSPSKRRSQSSAQQQPPPPSNNNLLDFTPGAPPSRPAMMVDQELANAAQKVTPGRRGRPTRDSIKSQPPPPQLPSGATSGPPVVNKMSVTGEGAKAKGPSPTRHQYGASMSVKAPPKLDTQNIQRPSPQASVDAFGLPTNKATVTSPGGFGDAFGVSLKSTKSPVSTTSPSGFGDAFGVPLRSAKSPTASSPAGFGDSFVVRKTTLPSSAADKYGGLGRASNQPPPPQLPSRGFSDNFGKASPPLSARPSQPSPPVSAKPTRPSPIETSPQKMAASLTSLRSSNQTGTKSPVDPSSSIPDGELTFEQRFPSIEALSSGQHTPPAPSPPLASPPTAVATAKPAHIRRPSLAIANLTGGDLASANRSPKVTTQLPPQPRSTHVTGTAFKASNDRHQGLRVPSPDKRNSATSATADYLDLLDDEVGAALQTPEDLMGDEGSESSQIALAPLRPVLSKTPSSGSRFGVSPSAMKPPALLMQQSQPPVAPKPKPASLAADNKTQGAAQRATLPPLSASRPTSNFNSEMWSPLERMRSSSVSTRKSPTSPSSGKDKSGGIEPDSSDDDAGPEDVSGGGRRPSSPPRYGRVSPAPGIARRMSAYEPGAIPGLPASRSPAVSPATSTFAFNVRQPSQPSGRPKSMYVGASPTALSPPTSDISRSSSPAREERHLRRSSINDIVSRYEALSTDKSPRSPSHPLHDLPANGNGVNVGVQRKPSVRAKPPTLAAKPSIVAPSAPPTVAAKPLMLRKPSGSRPPPPTLPVLPASSAVSQPFSSQTVTVSSRAPPSTQPKPASLRNVPQLAGGDDRKAFVSAVDKVSSVSQPVTVPASGGRSARDSPTHGGGGGGGGGGGAGGGSSGSSPEKQQPVNVLIARWNKGK